MREINPLFKQELLAPHPAKDIRKLFREDTPEEAVDLIMQLLEYEPSKRMTAKKALSHPFFDEIRKKANKKKTTANREANQPIKTGQDLNR